MLFPKMKERIDYYMNINKLKPEPGALVFRRFVVSLCTFIFCFYAADLINQFFTAMVGKLIGYSPLFSFYEVKGMPMDWKEWSKARIFVFFSSGPHFVLLLGLFSWYVHRNAKKTISVIKPLSLWFSFCCILLYLSYLNQIVLGTGSPESPFYYGFSVIASWYWFGKPLMAPISLIGIGLTVIYAYLVTVDFLELNSSLKRINNLFGKRNFVLYNVVLPVVVGATIIIGLRIGSELIRTTVYLVSIFIAVFVIWLRSKKKFNTLKIVRGDSLDKSELLVILTLSVLLFLIHFNLSEGVRL